MTDNLKSGDFISHISLPKTVGILLEREASISLGGYLWSVWWIKHPDIEEFGQFTYTGEKWLKPFKPWPGFYKNT